MEDNLKKLVEEKLNDITKEGLNLQDLQVVSELVDVHKDLCNEDYWKAKKEAIKMRYNRGYGEYDDYMRDTYDRRGVPGTGRGRYRGEDTMDDMYDAYRKYSDGRIEMDRGNYSAKPDTMRSLEYMMKSVMQFLMMLKDEASPEEMHLIREYTRKISEMI